AILLDRREQLRLRRLEALERLDGRAVRIEQGTDMLVALLDEQRPQRVGERRPAVARRNGRVVETIGDRRLEVAERLRPVGEVETAQLEIEFRGSIGFGHPHERPGLAHPDQLAEERRADGLRPAEPD
ncbi:MAG: hypothetical protein ACK559_00640, partial [bacterium]